MKADERKGPVSLIRWTPRLYSRISKYYDFFGRIFFPIGEKGHMKVVEGLQGGIILDVACGTGTLLEMAYQRGLSCYGLDTSQGMLAEASKKIPQANFKLASFYEMPFPDESFEYVVETNAVSGVEIDVEQVLKEMVRVCKIGGEIRIADYAKSHQPTWMTKIVERMLILVGDFAYDYVSVFKDFDYQPEVEPLGWKGMYQFIRIQRTR
jgi:ubiquinone/menaquinone biosynthesis C-methylase UbiE